MYLYNDFLKFSEEKGFPSSLEMKADFLLQDHGTMKTTIKKSVCSWLQEPSQWWLQLEIRIQKLKVKTDFQLNAITLHFWF